MAQLIDGARQLPLRHISIRVPWNDIGWKGNVCQRPGENVACLILKNIRASRNDQAETAVSGQSWENLGADKLPACLSEHGHFMADYEITRSITHPYAKSSPAHKHLLPTPYRMPIFSAAALPFAWMLKEMSGDIIKKLELGFQPELEDKAHEAMGFPTEWVQTKHNQRVMLDTFFSAIKPQKSLVFYYAKATPLMDDPRRVIIGAGHVTSVGDFVEYRYGQPGPLESILWERNVQHSIRSSCADGFLLPYQEVLAYLNEHQEEDPAQYVAFVPDDQFMAFSYGSEHVTNDGAIAALLSCAKALQNIQKIVPGAWEKALNWLNSRINELWAMRGPCPGLGAALSAFGVENGTLIAYELERILSENPATAGTDPWPLVDQLFANPESLAINLKKNIGNTLRLKWAKLPEERRSLLKLLSRFELSVEQATRYYVHEDEERVRLHIEATDKELLENPYRIYELDRITGEPIALAEIDRGMFPETKIREKYPLPQPSLVDDPLDMRRIRGFIIRQLEDAALQGDTLRPRADLIREIRMLDAQPACPIDGDTMDLVEDFMKPEVVPVDLANGNKSYQLTRFASIGAIIRSNIQKRINGARNTLQVNWREKLDQVLAQPVKPGDEEENKARQEKSAALAELFASRFSVLIGPAGTGKTTLLKVLYQDEQVQNGGVLMLAPTGKARVRMEMQTGIKGASTIAQFLLMLDRYDPKTGRYHLSDRPRADAGKTVIIDEASMLTEEQLAAVLDALKGVDRLVLVGDPRQLPPIGAGRPFLDIVRELAPEKVESIFPKIGPGYAELTVRRRQKGSLRDDLLLAEWFSGRPLDSGADEIWDRIRKDEESEQLRFVQWEDSADLQDKLLKVLVEELKLKGREDASSFEISLGGMPYNNSVFFWPGRDGKAGSCGKVEDWQILSPVRSAPHGVEAINRLIQSTFRSKTKGYATQIWRKIPKPMGREEILYGDKVINVKNQRRYDVYPEANCEKYVANGEIGVVVGQYKTQNFHKAPWKMEVEFSSQPAFKYGYDGRDFGEENQATLELAYALTVHKTQGSEFGMTFVIIPNPCRLLSRELLYTALTRQKDRIIIFHQGDRHQLKVFSDEYYSESARRLTNLFRSANPVELQDRFLEEGLIHKTMKGESVRSKSEVIISNLLYSAGIDYTYELRLVGQDGSVRYPDFTIEDAASGQKFYWEHLGMMNDPGYRSRWEKKLAWYRSQGVNPIEEGGGPNGTLVISADDEKGGIDSGKIKQIIEKIR